MTYVIARTRIEYSGFVQGNRELGETTYLGNPLSINGLSGDVVILNDADLKFDYQDQRTLSRYEGLGIIKIKRIYT